MTVKSRWGRITDIAIRLMATACLIAIICLSAEQREAQKCFKEYVDTQARTTAARAAAAQADREAQNKLYSDIVNEPRQSIAALNAFLQSQRETDRQRAANPPPPPLSAACQ